MKKAKEFIKRHADVKEGISGSEMDKLMKKGNSSEILDKMADSSKDAEEQKMLSKMSDQLSKAGY